MKREYVKPIFYAEEYKFNENFATDCTVHVDPNEPLTFDVGDNVCAGDGGHRFCDKGLILKDQDYKGVTSVTLFNDGSGYDGGCLFDWAGIGTKVVGPDGVKTYGAFQQAFFGDEADNPNHAPAFKGKPMFS